MCLGVPGQVLEADATRAVVDFFGVRRVVSLDLLERDDDDAPGVRPGDFVLVHVGFALRRISPEDVEATLAFFAALEATAPEAWPPPEDAP